MLFRLLLIIFSIFILAGCSLKKIPEHENNNPYDPFSPNYNDELSLGYWEGYYYKSKNDFKYYDFLPGAALLSSYLIDKVFLFGGNIYGYGSRDVTFLSMNFIDEDTLYFEMELNYPMLKARKEASVIYWPDLAVFYIFGGDKEATYEKYSRWGREPQDTILYSLPDKKLVYGTESILLKDLILLIGGESVSNEKSDKIWAFKPDSLKWFVLDTLPLPMSFTSAKVVGNKLYLLGGFTIGNSPLNTIFVYDLLTHKWESFRESLPFACGRIITVVNLINNEPRIYCMGGYAERDLHIMSHNNLEIKLDAQKIIKKKDIPFEVEHIYYAYTKKSRINIIFKENYGNEVSIIYFHLPYFK